MSAYKDAKAKDKKKQWYVKFRCTYYDGTSQQILKRGFRTKKEAEKYEEEYLLENSGTNEDTFDQLFTVYLEDEKTRTKYTTYKKAVWTYEKFLSPEFGNKSISAITPRDIRLFQNKLLDFRKPDGTPYSKRYIKSIEIVLNAFLNFCVKFHGLKQNPMQIAGTVGTKSRDNEMKIWTEDDFVKAIAFETREDYKLALSILFYTGIRLGELRGLQWEKINFDEHYILIDSNLQEVDKGIQRLTTPKTKDSKRRVYIDSFLEDDIKKYKEKQYVKTGLIFDFCETGYGVELHKLADKAELPNIRIHDLRHSHASYLIHHGVNILLISKRLGHTSIKMTLDTYSHLFPDETKEVGKFISELRAARK